MFDTTDIESWLKAADAKRRRAPERTFAIDMRDGRWFWARETIFDGGWMLLTMSDITELKANEQVLLKARDAALHWAETDELTGLHNRRFAMARLDQCVAGAHETGTILSAGIIDIDHFNGINDGHRHDAGDQVLKHFRRYRP